MQVRQVTLRAPDIAGGNQSYEVTGFGQPDAVIFVATTGDTDSTPYIGSLPTLSLGFYDGTNEHVAGFTIPDNVAAGAGNHRQWNNSAYCVNVQDSAAVDRTASVSGWATDGVTITWDTTSGFRPYVTAILIKGINGAAVGASSLTSANSPVTITTTGITPKLVLFASTQIGVDSVSNEPRFSMGFAYDNGTTFENYSTQYRYRNTDPSEGGARVNTASGANVCMVTVPGSVGNINTAGRVTDMASGSFEVTQTDGTLTGSFMYIALDFAADVKTFTSAFPQSTASDWQFVTTTWTPEWAFGFPTGCNLLDTNRASGIAAEVAAVYSANKSGDEDCHIFIAADGQATTQVTYSGHWTSYRLDYDASGTLTAEAEAHTPTFESTGIRFPSANINDAAGDDRYFVGFAIEEVPAGVDTPILIPTGPVW